MGVSLDLRKAWKHHRHGDLLVVLTWVNDERSLVLMPTLRRGTGWYIVQESAAFKWGIDHPDPSISRPAMTHAIGQAEDEFIALERKLLDVSEDLSVLAFEIDQATPPRKKRLAAEEADMDGTTPTH